jgi:hypothetical protein
MPEWLVNLYFTGDPIGPADRTAWEREVAPVKTQLGVSRRPSLISLKCISRLSMTPIADDPEKSSAKVPTVTAIKGKATTGEIGRRKHRRTVEV